MDFAAVDSFKLNFNGWALDNPSYMGIGGMIKAYTIIVLRAFSKLTRKGFTINANILAVLKGLLKG